MDRSESLLGKIGNWLTNATIGASVYDRPEVTTASGWQRDADGRWNQDAVMDPGVVKLRNNLAEISGLAYGAEMEPLVEGAWQVVRHPVQTGKAVYKVATAPKRYVSKVRGRYKNANTHIAPESEIKHYVVSRYTPSSRNSGYYVTKDFPFIREGELIKSPGGIRLKPGATMEIHMNPDYYYDRGVGGWKYHHSDPAP